MARGSTVNGAASVTGVLADVGCDPQLSDRRGEILGIVCPVCPQAGPAAATTATAQKIAVIFYTMVKNQLEYDATLWAQRDKRIEAKLMRQAQHRRYKLVPIETDPEGANAELRIAVILAVEQITKLNFGAGTIRCWRYSVGFCRNRGN